MWLKVAQRLSKSTYFISETASIAALLTFKLDSILAETQQEPVIQSLPQDREGLLRHLEKTNPESLALARDWDDTARSLIKAQNTLEEYVRFSERTLLFLMLLLTFTRLEQENPDAMSLGINHLHYRKLLRSNLILRVRFIQQ